MDQGEAFHRAICENPADDLPRLVYSDFLDETGDPVSAAWAEFIRLQVEIAKMGKSHEWCDDPVVQGGHYPEPCMSCDGCSLRGFSFRREASLYIQHIRRTMFVVNGMQWCPQEGLKNWRRGFPYGVTATVNHWTANGPDFVQRVPLTDLRFINITPDHEGDVWGFHCHTRTRFRDSLRRGFLPPKWFDLLPPDLHQYPDPSLGRWYDSPHEAQAAVGHAALNGARGQAKLPLLEWATSTPSRLPQPAV